ncbi:hypothetical protein PORY_000541 [Pneumocystis oryctolagi]|uniref:Uncharacterized protein n=1 Tax=Pneumocystis oryctolagi TaxID=42067 RepID=A0ACB7CFY5_9ASCO|nr:hypothetical protein PORY_000541 [Pneumocystis oryctolagi]
MLTKTQLSKKKRFISYIILYQQNKKNTKESLIESLKMMKCKLKHEMAQEDIFIPTETSLTNSCETRPSKIQENWSTLIVKEDIQEIQENLDFLFSKLEKENKQLMDNPKRISSQFLKNKSKQYIRDLIDLRVNDPIISSFPINKIVSTDNIENLDFWISLISDYSVIAIQSPHFLTKKIREGIPHPLRGLVWQSMSGAQDMHLEGLFETLRNEQSPYEKVIVRDLARTFPSVEMFKEEGGDGQKKLQSVLRAFSLYDAEVGYCQGLGFIVGPLLMNMSEYETFCVLVRLMECYDMRTMFTVNLSGLHLRLFQFEHFLSLRLPSVATYFNSIGIHPLMYASQWFLSLFAVTCPLSTLHRIYDIIFGEGAPETIIRVAIALLIKNEKRLLNVDFEGNLQLLLSPELWAIYNQNDDELISEALKLDNIITRDSLTELEQKFNQNISKKHKTLSKPTTSEIQPTSGIFEKLQKNSNTSLPIFLNSSTNPNSFYGNNDIQKIPQNIDVSTFPPMNTVSSESERTDNLASTNYLDKKQPSRKASTFNNSYERDNKELHYQIEDLVVALSSLQREHASTTEDLDILRRISIKYRNISLELINLINETLNLNNNNNNVSSFKESDKQNLETTNITDSSVIPDKNYKNGNYDKSKIIEQLTKELNDSSLPPNPLAKELSFLQEKLSREQSKIKNLEEQIDLKELEIISMKDQIHNINLHWNEMTKEKQEIQKAISEKKYEQFDYINNLHENFLNSYNNAHKSLQELNVLQNKIVSKNTSTSSSQQTYNFSEKFAPSLSISNYNSITQNTCTLCERMREELTACKNKLALCSKMLEEARKPRHLKKAIFNGPCVKSKAIDINLVSSTLDINSNSIGTGYYNDINSNNNLVQPAQSMSFKSSDLTTNVNIEDSRISNNNLFINPSQSLSDTLKELNHQRVSLILEINTLLLQKCIELQNTKSIEKDHSEASEVTMTGFRCIQRLQTNLAYLATVADKSYKNNENYIYKNPIILSPPSNVYTLIEPYAKLKSLFFVNKSPPIPSSIEISNSSQLLKNSSNIFPTEQSKLGNSSNVKANLNTFSMEKNESINIYNQHQLQNLPAMTIQQPYKQPLPQQHPTQLTQSTDTHFQHIQPSFQ